MYYVYFDKVLFPIAPSEIETTVDGNNKSINLINQSEVNIIKGVKLPSFKFDLRLPNHRYPHSVYSGGVYHEAKYFLDKIEAFKKSKKPFSLKIIRQTPDNKSLFATSIKATLESYTMKENAEDDGTDVTVSVKLKQYRTYGTTVIKVKKKKTYKLTVRGRKKIKKSYTTKKGNTLHNISKKVYGKYTYNNAWAIYNKNKKAINKALYKKYKNKYSKRILTTSLPAKLKLSIPQKGDKYYG